jgi:hypothetical protein
MRFVPQRSLPYSSGLVPRLPPISHAQLVTGLRRHGIDGLSTTDPQLGLGEHEKGRIRIFKEMPQHEVTIAKETGCSARVRVADP